MRIPKQTKPVRRAGMNIYLKKRSSNKVIQSQFEDEPEVDTVGDDADLDDSGETTEDDFDGGGENVEGVEGVDE
jgi:hypothetical protein